MWQVWVVKNSRSWVASRGPKPGWSVRTTPVTGGQGLVGQIDVQHDPGAGSLQALLGEQVGESG